MVSNKYFLKSKRGKLNLVRDFGFTILATISFLSFVQQEFYSPIVHKKIGKVINYFDSNSNSKWDTLKESYDILYFCKKNNLEGLSERIEIKDNKVTFDVGLKLSNEDMLNIYDKLYSQGKVK
ncbi:MAG: hypothetical protein NUV46_04355 [Nanoarchaeota archaeon]|nr:hypothetical protein [Nanoarchaeota archaeon]